MLNTSIFITLMWSDPYLNYIYGIIQTIWTDNQNQIAFNASWNFVEGKKLNFRVKLLFLSHPHFYSSLPLLHCVSRFIRDFRRVAERARDKSLEMTAHQPYHLRSERSQTKQLVTVIESVNGRSIVLLLQWKVTPGQTESCRRGVESVHQGMDQHRNRRAFIHRLKLMCAVFWRK